MSAHSEADMTDARDVLSWLLTEHATTLHGLAFRLAQGDAAMTAVVSNASRAWAAACEALAATPGREKLLALISDLADEDPCWYDHHGGCQAHGYLSLQEGERCPHAVAKELLAPADGEQTGGGRG